MRILVTGASGMIGSHLVKGLTDAGYDVVGVDRIAGNAGIENYTEIIADLSDLESLKRIVSENGIDRVIHLAALAHTSGEQDLSYERYFHVNVECAKNVFHAAGNRPVLFISTVDVYGFVKGVVNGETEVHPVTNYGKTKALAEAACREICETFTIFRFSPVYTPTVKRDIQKRYYLKYPKVAYRVGKGTSYEILNVTRAVAAMVGWCGEEPKNDVKIIKDETPMWTPDYIKAEKEAGRAKIVLRFPRWMVNCGYTVLKGIMGENEKVYLLNKAVHPLRSE